MIAGDAGCVDLDVECSYYLAEYKHILLQYIRSGVVCTLQLLSWCFVLTLKRIVKLRNVRLNLCHADVA